MSHLLLIRKMFVSFTYFIYGTPYYGFTRLVYANLGKLCLLAWRWYLQLKNDLLLIVF